MSLLLSRLGGPINVTLGLPAETETALAVKVTKLVALGLPTELETALAVKLLKRVALGQPTETETALALKVVRVARLGLPVETETAQSLKLSKVLRLGLPTETETAQALKLVRRLNLGLPVETESALALTITLTPPAVIGGGGGGYHTPTWMRQQQQPTRPPSRLSPVKDGAGRVRYVRRRGTRVPLQTDFVNPYPWMPGTDARVYIGLTQRRVPFSYRYFNVFVAEIAQLLPGWAPEFTLKDYKIVITVKGTFFGNIPGVLINDVLAKVILERAGWKFYTWFEVDIVRDVDALFNSVPQLRRPTKHGGVYRNPYGQPDVMAQFRALRARRHVYVSTNVIGATRGQRRHPRRRGGAFSTTRLYRDYRRELSSRPRSRRRRGF